jgi:hypothetical protein
MIRRFTIRRFLFPLIALVALSPPFLCAQAKASGTIPSSGGGAACVSINVDAQATVAVQVTGTWTGTLQPEISVQGQAAANTQVTPSTSTTPASTITANGVYRSSVAGGSTFLVCGNTVASGTANIYLNATTASAGSGLSGGGSGSGTVNSGTANQIAIYPSNGTAVSGDSKLTDDGTTTTYSGSGGVLASAGPVSSGANGGAAGVWKAFGSTSGSVTCTAPAVAGTSTNPLTCSNIFLAPVGASSTPGYGFTGDATTGMFDNGPGNLMFTVQGTALMEIAGGGATGFRGNQPIGFAASSLPAALDTGISRAAADVFAFGNGTAANETALLRAGNPCRITADVSLTVNTANSFCSWSLPAVAKSWAWICDIQWAITAGSGTNTFAVGVNASQTPTATTNGFAQIYTTTSGTQTMAPGIAISASGAINLLTSPTYTPAAQVLFAHTSGTIAASGTAGTFAVTAAANGTTATAAVKAGSTCMLY